MAAGEQVIHGEHVVWTWSRATLADTGAGYGPIARSSRWPYDTRADPTGGLGPRVRFLEPGSEPLLEERPAPYSLAMDVVPEGIRVIRKQFLGRDSYGRNSRWLVHGMVFPPGSIGPVDVLAADAAAQFDVHVDDDLALRTDLPPVRLLRRPREPAAREPLGRWAQQARLLLASALAVSRRDLPGPVMVQAEESAHLAWMFELAFGLLPPTVAARLSFSTFEGKPGTSRVDLVGCVAPFSEAVRDGRPWLDLAEREGNLPDSPSGPMETADVLIDQALAGHTPPERLTDVEELIRWAHAQTLLRRPPASLSTRDLLDLLAEPETVRSGETQPQSGETQPRSGETQPRSGETQPRSDGARDAAEEDGQTVWGVALARLGAAAPEDASVLLRRLTGAAVGRDRPGREEVAAGLVELVVGGLAEGETSFGCLARREIAAAVGDLLGEDPLEVSCRVVAAATDRLRGDRTPVVWPHGVPGDVVDQVVAVSTQLSVEEHRTWLAQPDVGERVAGSWNPISATLTADTLTGRFPASSAFRLLLSRCPDDVAGVVDDLLERRIVDDTCLRELAASLPVAALPTLFEALLAGRRVDRGFLLFDLLADPRLDDESTRRECLVPLLRKHWQALGLGAHLPAAVVRCLRVDPHPAEESPPGRRRWGLRRP